MNQNNPKSFTQFDKSPEIPLFSKVQNSLETIYNPRVSPINRVSILKTEEQKEIVRTNVYDPNDSSGNKKEFCVVTEIIKRPKISFNSKINTFSRFSFNQPISVPSFNQFGQNVNLRIEINNSKTKKSKKNDNYKLIVNKIASQLNTQIRPPSQGFFFFAFQKGEYPLLIIKKIEKEIINHTIDLDNNIFAKFYEKYLKYMELVKKIAFLLKKNMKNKMFWENERYNTVNIDNIKENQNIQVKIINKNIPNIQSKNKITSKNKSNYIPLNKATNNIKSGIQSQTTQNIKKPQIIFNKKINNDSSTNIFTNNINQKKTFTELHSKKITSFNEDKNISTNNNNQNIGNIGSHRLNAVINPFIKNNNQLHNKNNQMMNKEYSTKYDIANKQLYSKNQNNKSNINQVNIPVNITNKAEINNEKNLIKEDIEMKEDFNKINNDYNYDIISDKIIDNNLNVNKKEMQYSNVNNASNNNIQNNQPIIRNNNFQKTILSSSKSQKKTLQIKFSTFKKTDKLKIATESKSNLPLKEEIIDINSIIIPKNNIKITNEHNSFVNKFNIFLSNNDIKIEYNIPISKEEKGKTHLKKHEFWMKYINYLYINYLTNKSKISLYTFSHLIEQYFIWCENNDSNMAKEFKYLIIDIIYKIYENKEINQFLEMNKLNKIEELFAKYEIVLKYGNIDKYNAKKEIEIKIDDNAKCNCDLCKNEIASFKKMSEINKQLNTDVKIENLFIKSEYPHKEDDKQNRELYKNNYKYEGNNRIEIFNKLKTLQSSESSYQYLPPKDLIKREKTSESKYKENDGIVIKLKENEDKKEKFIDISGKKENFNEISNNMKIVDFFVSDKKNGEKKSEKKNKSKQKSSGKKSKSKNKKSYSNKKEKSSNKKKEEKKNIKNKNNKKDKSKPKSKNYRKHYPVSESESESYSENNDSDYESKKTFAYPKKGKGKRKK